MSNDAGKDNANSALACALSSLLSFADFQAANAEIFPRTSSLLWFWRVHRTELIEAGAVLRINGRLLIDSDKFSQAARVIGTRLVRLYVERD